MTKQRVFALALSTLSTWGLVVALLYVIAQLDHGAVETTRASLNAAAGAAQTTLGELDTDLPGLAAELAHSGIDGDLRFLGATLAAVKPGGQPNAFQQNRIATFTEEPMTNCTDSRVAYSPVEVAKMLGVSHDTLHRWWKRGEGPPRLKVGGRVLVPKQALEELVEGTGYISGEPMRNDTERTIKPGRLCSRAPTPIR